MSPTPTKKLLILVDVPPTLLHFMGIYPTIMPHFPTAVNSHFIPMRLFLRKYKGFKPDESP